MLYHPNWLTPLSCSIVIGGSLTCHALSEKMVRSLSLLDPLRWLTLILCSIFCGGSLHQHAQSVQLG